MKLKTIILIFFCLQIPVFAEEGYYSLSYKMNSVVASIELNGIIQTEATKDGFKSGVSTGLNLWIMPGENTLKIKLIKASQKGKNTSEPNIAVNVRLGQAGQSSDEGKEITGFTTPELEGEKISFPLEKEIKFTPELIPPSELWDKAETIVLDESSKKEIIELIQSLHKAANTGNTKKFLSLNEFKMNDLSKAMFSNSDADKQRNEKGMTEFLKMIKGKLEKMPKNFKFRLVANDKLIYVTDAKGNDVIKTKSSKDDGAFEIPVYISKVNGTWILAR